MTKRVIFLNGEPRAETAWLGARLREAGFDYKTSPAVEETDGDEARGNGAKEKKAGARKKPPVLAVLCAVAEEADVGELRTMVKRACVQWPEASLVAYRLLGAAGDDFDESVMDEASPVTSERLRPNVSTLRRLGFTQIADAPEQLPALLRGLAARGTSGEFPRPRFEFYHAPTSARLPDALGVERLRVAFEFASALHFAFDREAAAETAIAAFVRLVRADAWTIYLTTGDALKSGSASLEILATTNKASESDQKFSQAAREAAMGDTIRIAGNGRRTVAVPLVSDERIVGVIEAVRVRARSRAFTDAEVALLAALSAPLAAALANVGRVAEAERLSQTDDLTKLHNARFMRQCLISEVKRARRYGSTVSAVFLDLDDFKQVNDRHGHLVGSHVLIELAAVILQSVRDTDIVARYGGDEFVVILPETPALAAHRVAERIRAAVADCAFTGGRESLRLNLTASFGVAAFPEHAQSPQQLIVAADTAMYEAKAARKNCVVIARNGEAMGSDA